MPNLAPGVAEFATELRALGWVSELFVAGSAATGDYRPRVSDLDLVALTDGPVTPERRTSLARLHARLDAGAAAGLDLGCVYVPGAALADLDAVHPTWTHGRLVDRILSAITRAELVRHGFAVFGGAPQDVLAAVSDDDVRRAARAELVGYWARAGARPWWFLDPVIAELAFTSMARGRYELRTGQLLTKSRAIAHSHAPPWLVAQLHARRRGEDVSWPRLRAAWFAWRDVRRTTAGARRGEELVVRCTHD